MIMMRRLWLRGNWALLRVNYNGRSDSGDENKYRPGLWNHSRGRAAMKQFSSLSTYSQEENIGKESLAQRRKMM